MKVDEAGFLVDLSAPSLVTGIKFGLGGERLLKIRLLHPTNSISASVDSKNWSTSMNFATKDMEFAFQKPVKPGVLHVKQIVPKGRWELVPSPSIKLCMTPISRGRFKEEVDVGYDFLASQGSVEQRLTLDKLTVSLKASTARSHGLPFLIPFHPLVSYPFLLHASTKGSCADASITYKFNKPWIKSLTADWSRAFGPTLAYRAAPCETVSTEMAISAQRKQLWMAVELLASSSPQKKVRFTAEATFSKSHPTKPALLLGFLFEP